eukprot:2314216-Amphidinium_carterae.1
MTWQTVADILATHLRETKGCKLKFLIVRACYGHPMAKAANRLGLDALAWTKSPPMDICCRFLANFLLEAYQHGKD